MRCGLAVDPPASRAVAFEHDRPRSGSHVTGDTCASRRPCGVSGNGVVDGPRLAVFDSRRGPLDAVSVGEHLKENDLEAGACVPVLPSCGGRRSCEGHSDHITTRPRILPPTVCIEPSTTIASPRHRADSSSPTAPRMWCCSVNGSARTHSSCQKRSTTGSAAAASCSCRSVRASAPPGWNPLRTRPRPEYGSVRGQC